MNFNEAQVRLGQALSSKKYEHTLGVVGLAKELAGKFGIDAEKAKLAGLLHDYARELTDQELLKIARKENLIIHQVEELVPMLLHGSVGAFLAKSQLGIKDQTVLDAIKYHTTGRREMSPLEQIIYIADVIEPNRQFPCVKELRQEIAEITELTEGLELLLDRSLIYNIKKGALIHPLTVDGLNWVREKKVLSLLKKC